MSASSRMTVLGGILAILIVGGVAKVVGREVTEAGMGAYKSSQEEAQVEELLSTIHEKGPMAPMYGALREEFPARFENMMEEMRKVARSATTPDEAKQRMMTYSRGQFADLRKAAPQGSEASIRKIVQTQLSMITMMENFGDEACGRYVREGAYMGMPESPEILLGISTLGAA